MGNRSSVRVLTSASAKEDAERREQEDLLDLRISGPAREVRPEEKPPVAVAAIASVAAIDPRLRVLDQIPALVWTTDRELRFTSALGAALVSLGLDSGRLA